LSARPRASPELGEQVVDGVKDHWSEFGDRETSSLVESCATPTVGVKLPRVGSGAVVPPTDDVVGSIYKAAAPEFQAAVVLGAAIGLRQAKAAALTVERIDWLRRTVRIDRQWSQVDGWAPPKTRASTRTVPVAEEVLEVLARHIAVHDTGTDGVLVHWGHGDGPMGHAAVGEGHAAGGGRRGVVECAPSMTAATTTPASS
jgi:integrase